MYLATFKYIMSINTILQVTDAEVTIDNTTYTSIAFNPQGFFLFQGKKIAKLFNYTGSKLEMTAPYKLLIKDKEGLVISMNIQDERRYIEVIEFFKSKISTINEEQNVTDRQPLTNGQRRSLYVESDLIQNPSNIKRNSLVLNEHPGTYANLTMKQTYNDCGGLPEKCGLYETIKEQKSYSKPHSREKKAEIKITRFKNSEKLTINHNTKDSEVDNDGIGIQDLPESQGPFNGPHKIHENPIKNDYYDTDQMNTPIKRPSVFKRIGSFLFNSGKRGSIFSNKSSKTSDSNINITPLSKQRSKASKKVGKRLYELYRLLRISQKLKCEYKIKLIAIDSSYLCENKLGQLLDQYKQIDSLTYNSPADIDKSHAGHINLNLSIDDNISIELDNNDILPRIDLSDIDTSGIIKETKNSFKNLSKIVKTHIKKRLVNVSTKMAEFKPDLAKTIKADTSYDSAQNTNIIVDKIKQYKTFIEKRHAGKFDPDMQVYMLRVDLQYFLDLAKNLIPIYDELLFLRGSLSLDHSFSYRLNIVIGHLITFKQAFISFIKLQVMSYCKSLGTEMRKMYHSIFNFVNDYWVFEDVGQVAERAYIYLFGLWDEIVKETEGLHESASLFVIT